MYRIRLSKKQIRNHFYYDKWKYGLGIVLVIFVWGMLSTITAPRTPADKKVDIYLVGGNMLELEATEYSETVRANFPELLEVNIYNIAIEGELEYAGRQKLMVMLGSQSGDVFSFKRDEFESMLNMDIFVPLDDYPELLSHFSDEELSEGTFTREEDPTPRIYGVPISGVKSINRKFFNTENTLMGVMAYSENIEKSIEVMQWIMEHKEEEQYVQRKHELYEVQGLQ